MLRCAASLIIAGYVKVRLILWALRALPLELFTRSSLSQIFTVLSSFAVLSLYWFFASTPVFAELVFDTIN